MVKARLTAGRDGGFLLVHGAWHGGWCWRGIVRRLEARGYRALAPDLPGHGDDPAPPAAMTLPAYADRICALLDAAPGPVVLVGHSMGGIVISEAAERRPERVRALVYVTAFLLPDGTSIADATRGETGSVARNNRIASPDRSLIATREEAVAEAFYGNCTAADIAYAKARLGPQALAPFLAKIAVSDARFGRVPRYYVQCLRDRAITPDCQRRMAEALPCRRVFMLDTDHSPFFSAPDELTEILLTVAAEA